MPSRTCLVAAFALPVVLTVAAPAMAATVTYTDRSTFDAAVSVTDTDTFEDLVGFQQPNPLVRGNISYVSTDDSGLFNTPGSGGFSFNLPSNYLAAQNTGGIRLDFTTGVTAVGLDVAELIGSSTLNYTLSGEAGVLEAGSTSVGNAFQFLGFASTESIFSLELNLNEGSNFEAIDNVSTGSASPSVVPLPAGISLLIGALALLGFGHRRRVA